MASGGVLFRLDLRWLPLAGAGNFDPARFHLFGDFALELDRQHAVLELRTCYLDVVGKLEPALERTPGDAVVQILSAFLAGLLSADHQHVAFKGDVDLVLPETRQRHADAIVVLANLAMS